MPEKKRVAQARRRARELAVQVLYSMELRPGQDIGECLDAFTRWGFASGSGIDGDVASYMSFLAGEVWRSRAAIDDIMRRIVTGWRLERMVAVDRAVLRVAIFEGFLRKEVPVSVAISEAVDLAGIFGTEDSARFVNGVLAKVLRFTEAEDQKKAAGDGCDGENNAVPATKDSSDG